MTQTNEIVSLFVKIPENYTVYFEKDEFGDYVQVEWLDLETKKHVGIKKHRYSDSMCLIRVEHEPFDFIELINDQDVEQTIFDLLRK